MSLIRFKNSALPALVDTFFNRDTSDIFDPFQGEFIPSVNILENDEGFHIEMAAPGLKKENFQINLNQNNLSIAYANEDNKEEVNGLYTRREFRNSSFKRTFTIPQTIDYERISASYVDGIMKLILPKKEDVKVKLERLIDIN